VSSARRRLAAPATMRHRPRSCARPLGRIGSYAAALLHHLANARGRYSERHGEGVHTETQRQLRTPLW
jgi:hypothetical protein